MSFFVISVFILPISIWSVILPVFPRGDHNTKPTTTMNTIQTNTPALTINGALNKIREAIKSSDLSEHMKSFVRIQILSDLVIHLSVTLEHFPTWRETDGKTEHDRVMAELDKIIADNLGDAS